MKDGVDVMKPITELNLSTLYKNELKQYGLKCGERHVEYCGIER